MVGNADIFITERYRLFCHFFNYFFSCSPIGIGSPMRMTMQIAFDV